MINNKYVDIEFSAHDTFPELPSSGTLIFIISVSSII